MVLSELRSWRRRSKGLQLPETPPPATKLFESTKLEAPTELFPRYNKKILAGLSPGVFRATEARHYGPHWVQPNCRICQDFRNEEMPIRFTMSKCNTAAYWGCESCKLLQEVCKPYEEELAKFQLNAADVRLFGENLLLSFDRYGKGPNSIELEIHTIRGTHSPWPVITHYPQHFGVEDSAVAQEWIKARLEICDKSHDICRSTYFGGKSYLPTRLIEILGPTQVRLYVNDGRQVNERYACLSHCWGGVVPLQTTAHRLQDFQIQGIPWMLLPLTFKHAIEMTHRLGLKYLWIDSFCIIQDDLDDWRHEGSKMAEIYSGAYITLAATSAQNSAAGFYQSRSRSRDYPARTLTMRKVGQGGENYEIVVCEVPESSSFEQESLPLQQRAWFFQERLLSQRVVHFANNSLYWECLRASVNESSDRAKGGLDKMALNVQGIETAGTGINEPNRYNQSYSVAREIRTERRKWHQIVRHYSRCKLTFGKDMLPALQGVATHIKARRKSEYYAGVWGDNVLFDLLWLAEAMSKNQSEEYRAPSWSWARSAGSVRWEPQDEDFISEAEVVEIETTPAGLNPMGEVSAGYLKLKGKVLHATVKRINFSTTQLVRSSPRKSSQSWSSEEWWPDYSSTDLDEREIAVMWVGWSRLCSFCLVFAEISGRPGIYERVGCVDYYKFSGWNSFKDGVEQILTIV